MNPILAADFTFCTSDCEPLVPAVCRAAGIPDTGRNFWFGEGGPAAYEMGTTSLGYEELFVFSRTDFTVEDTADRYLRWAAVGTDVHTVIVSPDFSREFMDDLSSHQDAPVHFVRAVDDGPWFVPMAEGAVVPAVPSSVPPRRVPVEEAEAGEEQLKEAEDLLSFFLPEEIYKEDSE